MSADRGSGSRSRRGSDPFAAGDERGSWNIWAEGCRKMDGGGGHKGDEQAEEEVWESERSGRRGRLRRKDHHGESRLGCKSGMRWVGKGGHGLRSH